MRTELQTPVVREMGIPGERQVICEQAIYSCVSFQALESKLTLTKCRIVQLRNPIPYGYHDIHIHCTHAYTVHFSYA